MRPEDVSTHHPSAGIDELSLDSPSSTPRNRHSPRPGSRRRSQVLMNLHLNDPSLPAPGEMVSEASNASGTSSPQPIPPRSPHHPSHSPRLLPLEPRHNRAPSLGELHQELEAEQEAQVVWPLCSAPCRMCLS